MECHAAYRTDGPEHLRPVGETEYVAALADESERTPGATIVGIVGHADLTLPLDQLDEVLDAHEVAAGGRFRGIRDALSSVPPGVTAMIPGGAEPHRAANPGFRRGVAHLGERGFTYDTWQYHTQLVDLIDLARAVPGTTVVLDHFSTPLGIGPWAGRHDEVFEAWQPELATLAECPNVVAKLGGLAMPDNAFWPLGERPDVDGFLAVQERWYRHAIDVFGPTGACSSRTSRSTRSASTTRWCGRRSSASPRRTHPTSGPSSSPVRPAACTGSDAGAGDED